MSEFEKAWIEYRKANGIREMDAVDWVKRIGLLFWNDALEASRRALMAAAMECEVEGDVEVDERLVNALLKSVRALKASPLSGLKPGEEGGTSK